MIGLTRLVWWNQQEIKGIQGSFYFCLIMRVFTGPAFLRWQKMNKLTCYSHQHHSVGFNFSWWDRRSVRAALKEILKEKLQEVVLLPLIFCFPWVAEISFRFPGSNRFWSLCLSARYRCQHGSVDMLLIFPLFLLIAYLWVFWISDHKLPGKLRFKNPCYFIVLHFKGSDSFI